MSGYLFKRSHNNTFKKWNRRWFTLINSKLFYQRKNDYSGVCQIEPDLRVCKIREVNDNERRFTFEIVSPKCRHLLQADSQRECNEWVRRISKAIDDALNNSANKSIDNGDGGNISLNGPHNGGDLSNNEMSEEFLETIDFFNSVSQEATPSSFNGDLGSARNSSYKSLKDLENSYSSRNNTFGSAKKEERLKNNIIMSLKGNRNCCDCGAPNPTWVCIKSILYYSFLIID